MMTLANLAAYRDSLAELARDAYRERNNNAFGFLVKRYAALVCPVTLGEFYDSLTAPEADAPPPEAIAQVSAPVPHGWGVAETAVVEPAPAPKLAPPPPPPRPALQW